MCGRANLGWPAQRWPARARRWHGAWQEHRAAVARVAGCVTRQRISFRLFKLWYWGSFDEEIQARLARAEHHPAEPPLCSAHRFRTHVSRVLADQGKARWSECMHILSQALRRACIDACP